MADIVWYKQVSEIIGINTIKKIFALMVLVCQSKSGWGEITIQIREHKVARWFHSISEKPDD